MAITDAVSPRKPFGKASTRGKPSIATVIASLVAGGLQVANSLLLDSAGTEATWRSVITVVLAMVTAYGIQPLIGPAFANALHLPFKVLFAINSVIVGIDGALVALPLGTTAKVILTTLVTILLGLGFGAKQVVAAHKKPVVTPVVPPAG